MCDLLADLWIADGGSENGGISARAGTGSSCGSKCRTISSLARNHSGVVHVVPIPTPSCRLDLSEAKMAGIFSSASHSACGSNCCLVTSRIVLLCRSESVADSCLEWEVFDERVDVSDSPGPET